MPKSAPYTHRKYHVIYKTTCTVTGRWYIGMHSTNDLNDGYKGSGTRLARSMKKYGKDAHICEILEHHPNRRVLSEREKQIITEEMLQDPMCLNIGPGGEGNAPGYRTKEETLALISQRSKEMWAKRKADPVAMAEHIKKIATPEIVAKRAKANTGKKRTEAQKQNLKAGQERYYSSVDTDALKQRAAKTVQTRNARGTNKGGRPKGIPMSVAEKLKLGERMKAASPLSRRGTCAGCGKETTLVALNRYHIRCSAHEAT